MPAYKGKGKNPWFCKFRYKDFDGKTIYKTKRGFSTKREAVEWEQAFKMKNSGSSGMTLKMFSEKYMEDMKGRLKPDTCVMKQSLIDTWIVPYLGKLPMNEITTRDVMQWQNRLISYENSNGKGLSKSYLKTIHNQLSAMFNHGMKYYELKSNPAALAGNMGTDKEVKNSFWTKEQYLAFSEEMKAEPIYYYAFQILYWCGLREGEMLALTPDDIDFDKKIINVTKTYYVLKGKEYITKPKTLNSIRQVSMPDFLVHDLQDYLKMLYKPEQNERMFPLTKTMLSRAMDRGSASAGLPRIRIHDLRHSHVSLLIHMGWSPLTIGQRVGHSSVYITYHYAHMFPDDQQKLADSLDELKKGGE